MKRLKIKFEPFIFVNQYGDAVLAIQCPNCNFPVSILNPLREIYDEIRTGKIFVRANCSHCETGSLNEIAEEELSKIQKFVDTFCSKYPRGDVRNGRVSSIREIMGEKF